MTTQVFFLTLNYLQEIEIQAAQCTVEEYDTGFQFGDIFIPPWMFCSSHLEAEKRANITRHEVGLIDAA